MPSYQPGADTRNRLIEAAAEVFAEQGFHHARISDICQRAQANIAAVNYYFGDKEQLYIAVVHHMQEQGDASPDYLQFDDANPPEVQLRLFIHGFLSDLLKPCSSACLRKILTWEMMDPTSALDFMVETAIKPITDALNKIVSAIVKLPPKDNFVILSAASILSICMIYFTSKEIALRLEPSFINSDRTYSNDTIDMLAEHITDFSLRGMLGFSLPTPPINSNVDIETGK
jgi:AcrR family transcriptional regulator